MMDEYGLFEVRYTKKAFPRKGHVSRDLRKRGDNLQVTSIHIFREK